MDSLLAALYGFLAGFLGAVPFLHTNLMLQFTQDFFAASTLAVFATTLSFSHLVFETIPMLFFALPAQNQNITLLPAQSLVLGGKTAKAFKIVTQSLFYSVLIALALLPFAITATPIAHSFVQPVQGIALLAVIALAFYKSSSQTAGKLALGILFLTLAGLLGLTALSLPIAREPLFPLLSGLFGVPAILFSFKKNGDAKQKESENEEKTGENPTAGFSVDKKLIFYGVLAASASVLLPAVTPALIAGLIFAFMNEDRESFLTASTAVVGAKMVFDFAAVYSIGKARSGAAAVAQNALSSSANAGGIGLNNLLFLEAAGATAFFAALALLLVFGKQFAKAFRKFERNAVYAIALTAITAGTFLVSGAGGLLILASASAVGAGISLSKLRKSYAIGALVVPALTYFFGLNALFIQTVL
ncbi:tripartite tricarboxylate transporter permease [Candidatus Micrarchaeota archaeon]|nr:tripartite tricarboxylate transporter permease [Candidatus Micrarchaeota archaeon]